MRETKIKIAHVHVPANPYGDEHCCADCVHFVSDSCARTGIKMEREDWCTHFEAAEDGEEYLKFEPIEPEPMDLCFGCMYGGDINDCALYEKPYEEAWDLCEDVGALLHGVVKDESAT